MRYGAPSRDAQAYREEERLRRRLGEALLDARLVKAHLRVGGVRVPRPRGVSQEAV